MAIVSTTDVVQNTDSTRETITNGTCVVTCTPTGTSHSIDATFESSLTYAQLETKYTTRFDDIAYYNAVDGGTP